MVNTHFKQTITQQMAGNAEWQIGTRGVVDNGMKKGNWRLALLECGCTVRLIQEPAMENNPLVVT